MWDDIVNILNKREPDRKPEYYLTEEEKAARDEEERKLQEDKKKLIRKLKLGLVGIIVFMVFISNVYTLKPNEYGITKQFGKVVRVVDTPGPQFKIPFIQTVSIMPKNIQFYDVPPTEINTLDKKRIVVDYYTLWVIKDPVKLLETLKTIGGAEARLSDIMYSNIRNELGKLAYGDIINDENNNRGDVDTIVQDKINDILTQNNNGIEVVDIQMKRIDLPSSNEQAVYTRMISERQSKAQEYTSQGDSEKQTITAKADREVTELTAKTNTQAQEIIASGEQEAARIYNEAYGKDKEFFNLYTTLESYKTTIGNETVIVLPTDSPYLKYLIGK